MKGPHPESSWVSEHRADLVGMRIDEASSLVEQAGFRVWVYVEEPNSAMVLAYYPGLVRLIAADDRVVDVLAG